MEPKYEYQIAIDGNVVWKGLNPKEKYAEIKKKNPGKRISLAWKSKYDILVLVCKV